MKTFDAHKFFTEIRTGSKVARPISKSEYDVIDYSKIFDPESANRIKTSYSTLGFLAVRMPDNFVRSIKALHETNRDFFSLDEQTKRAIASTSFHQPDYGNVGYFPMYTEKAQSHELPDIKEFLHIGRREQFKENGDQLYVEIPWPEQLGEFASTYRIVYDEFASHCATIFLAIVTSFGLDIEYAKSLIHDGNSILRNIHYPPVEVANKAMRAAPHHGMNLIGLQVKSTHSGLQFCTHDDEWVYLDDWEQNVATVNIGRMTAFLLNGRAKPTLHRVVNDIDGSETESRYTSVMFFHGHPDAKLIPLKGEHDLPEMTVGAWTRSRLKDIRIK